MQRAPARYYLYCQSIGWGVLLVIFIASGPFLLHRETVKSLENALLTVLIGLFVTHLLRNAIRNQGWLDLSLRQGLPWLLLATASDTTVDLESITRSLEHIRALIDEDATSARGEVTAFSQLLRKGFLKVNDPQ